MKKILFVLFTQLFIYSDCGICIEPRGIEGAGLTITFINAGTNEYFYPESSSQSPLKLDSIEAKDSNGNLLETSHIIDSDPINPLKKFYNVSVRPIYISAQDGASFSHEFSKYIYFRYNYNTFDTLKIVYKAAKTKCGNKFEYLKAYYKGNLIAQASNVAFSGLDFTLKHE